MELKKILKIPKFLTVSTKNDNILFEGPLGSVNKKIPEGITILEKDLNKSWLTFIYNPLLNRQLKNKNKIKASFKTFEALTLQTFQGVSLGHRATLDLVGVGYRASVIKEKNIKKLFLKLGYSHPISLEIPSNLDVLCPKPTRILIKGCNKQIVFNFASILQKFKMPEPYKGKGILLRNSIIRRKEGKRS
jgi:large subunit ribosomal protein L6